MNSPANEVVIRRLRIEDAEDIGRIYGGITQKSPKADFKRLVKRHAQKGEDDCLVATLDGRVWFLKDLQKNQK